MCGDSGVSTLIHSLMYERLGMQGMVSAWPDNGALK